MQVFRLLHSTSAPHQETLDALLTLLITRLASILSLPSTSVIEPAKPPSSYGMESLAAVELRNWIRMELSADVTMLEILNAKSLAALGEKVLRKMAAPTT